MRSFNLVETAAVVFVMACIALFPCAVEAQDVIVLDDTSCGGAAGHCDPYTSKCTASYFTVGESDNYCIKAETFCDYTNCYHALACAWVRQGTTILGHAFSPCNDPGNCINDECDGDSEVYLSTHTTYNFVVCLLPCSLATCQDLPDCTARGTVYR